MPEVRSEDASKDQWMRLDRSYLHRSSGDSVFGNVRDARERPIAAPNASRNDHCEICPLFGASAHVVDVSG